jgi:transposase
MHSAATSQPQYTSAPSLFLAFELDDRGWKLGFTTGLGRHARKRGIAPRDLTALPKEIALAKKRFSLPAEARVFSCHEAGREGFWLHRWLTAQGVDNLVADAASIEVKQRRRRLTPALAGGARETDQVDLDKLLRMLVRHYAGEKDVWSIVHVPSVETENRRHCHRERWTLSDERTSHINRIKGLLASQGVHLSVRKDFPESLKAARTWDGSPLPARLIPRLQREYQRMQLVEHQIQEVEGEQTEALRSSDDPSVANVRHLMRLKAIGVHTAWPLAMELFSWRKFRNRREIGGLVGLASVPYQSGDTSQDQGMSKTGNGRLRALTIEMAWSWLRFQPESELSQWYQERFGHGGRRLRKIGAVALARKLLVALWRYLEEGEIPNGARLKPVKI